MSTIDKYYLRISEIMGEVFDKEHSAMEKAAQILAEANEKRRSIFGFGCNHAGLITLELFYRSGGMVTINPIRAPGMMLEISPPTMTSEMERMLGYGKIILDNEPAKAFVANNTGLKILETTYADEDYAACIKKGNTALREAVDKAIEDLIADGTIDAIAAKYKLDGQLVK